MVDIFALALSHGLLALAAWRLLWRPELDSEEPPQLRRRRKAMLPAKSTEDQAPDA